MLTLARRRLRLADPNLGGARGAAAASCGLGLKLRMPRVGAAPLSRPPLLMPPQRRSQSRPGAERSYDLPVNYLMALAGLFNLIIAFPEIFTVLRSQ